MSKSWKTANSRWLDRNNAEMFEKGRREHAALDQEARKDFQEKHKLTNEEVDYFERIARRLNVATHGVELGNLPVRNFEQAWRAVQAVKGENATT